MKRSHRFAMEVSMFKKSLEAKKVWGVSDPLMRQFLAGFFVGTVFGISIGQLLGLLP